MENNPKTATAAEQVISINNQQLVVLKLALIMMRIM